MLQLSLNYPTLGEGICTYSWILHNCTIDFCIFYQVFVKRVDHFLLIYCTYDSQNDCYCWLWKWDWSVSMSLLHGLSLRSQGTTAKWNEVKKSRSAAQLSGGKKKAAAVAVPPSAGGNHSTAVTTLLRWAVSWAVWGCRRLLEMDWMDGVHLVQYDVLYA